MYYFSAQSQSQSFVKFVADLGAGNVLFVKVQDEYSQQGVGSKQSARHASAVGAEYVASVQEVDMYGTFSVEKTR